MRYERSLIGRVVAVGVAVADQCRGTYPRPTGRGSVACIEASVDTWRSCAVCCMQQLHEARRSCTCRCVASASCMRGRIMTVTERLVCVAVCVCVCVCVCVSRIC